jgi:hypothetical protein
MHLDSLRPPNPIRLAEQVSRAAVEGGEEAAYAFEGRLAAASFKLRYVLASHASRSAKLRLGHVATSTRHE